MLFRSPVRLHPYACRGERPGGTCRRTGIYLFRAAPGAASAFNAPVFVAPQTDAAFNRFRIMAPETAKAASLAKHRCPYPRAVMYRKSLYMRNFKHLFALPDRIPLYVSGNAPPRPCSTPVPAVRRLILSPAHRSGCGGRSSVPEPADSGRRSGRLP